MDTIPGLRGVPLNDKQRKVLIERRTELGLTQRELADRIGRKTITIHTIEAGKYLASPKVLNALCQALSLDCNLMLEVHLSNGSQRVGSTTRTTIHKRRATSKRKVGGGT